MRFKLSFECSLRRVIQRKIAVFQGEFHADNLISLSMLLKMCCICTRFHLICLPLLARTLNYVLPMRLQNNLQWKYISGSYEIDHIRAASSATESNSQTVWNVYVNTTTSKGYIKIEKQREEEKREKKDK